MMNDIIEVNGEKYEKVISSDSQYCIIRTYSAGVFAGYIKERDGREAVVKSARRLWRWSGAASLSQLSIDGVKNPEDCKFPREVSTILLTEVIEIIPCTKKAEESIKNVEIWEV